jgi:hypothetical protein
MKRNTLYAKLFFGLLFVASYANCACSCADCVSGLFFAIRAPKHPGFPTGKYVVYLRANDEEKVMECHFTKPEGRRAVFPSTKENHFCPHDFGGIEKNKFLHLRLGNNTKKIAISFYWDGLLHFTKVYYPSYSTNCANGMCGPCCSSAGFTVVLPEFKRK